MLKGRLTFIALIKTKHVAFISYVQLLFVLNIFYCVNQKNWKQVLATYEFLSLHTTVIHNNLENK